MTPKSKFGVFYMGRPRSLQDVMNEVCASLNGGAIPPSSYSPAPLSELSAFMLFDPLLTDLHKKHADARGMRLQAQKEFGASDGMTDMAAMVEDSAWCALQTRYIELRSDRALMARVQKAMASNHAEEERLVLREKEKAEKERIDFATLFLRMHRQKNNDADLVFWLMILFCRNENTLWFRPPPVTYAFNRLAV